MAKRMATEEEIIEFMTIMVDFVASSPITLKTMVVKEDEAHHPYAFHVSGPSNVASPNWGDLINSSWKDPNYKRTIMGCIIQTAYLLELDRQENRIEQNAHAGLTLLSSYGSSNVCIEANSIRAGKALTKEGLFGILI